MPTIYNVKETLRPRDILLSCHHGEPDDPHRSKQNDFQLIINPADKIIQIAPPNNWKVQLMDYPNPSLSLNSSQRSININANIDDFQASLENDLWDFTILKPPFPSLTFDPQEKRLLLKTDPNWDLTVSDTKTSMKFFETNQQIKSVHLGQTPMFSSTISGDFGIPIAKTFTVPDTIFVDADISKRIIIRDQASNTPHIIREPGHLGPIIDMNKPANAHSILDDSMLNKPEIRLPNKNSTATQTSISFRQRLQQHPTFFSKTSSYVFDAEKPIHSNPPPQEPFPPFKISKHPTQTNQEYVSLYNAPQQGPTKSILVPPQEQDFCYVCKVNLRHTILVKPDQTKPHISNCPYHGSLFNSNLDNVPNIPANLAPTVSSSLGENPTYGQRIQKQYHPPTQHPQRPSIPKIPLTRSTQRKRHKTGLKYRSKVYHPTPSSFEHQVVNTMDTRIYQPLRLDFSKAKTYQNEIHPKLLPAPDSQHNNKDHEYFDWIPERQDQITYMKPPSWLS